VVNWCPKHKTALSDLEVKYVEKKDPLYYIKYGPLTLATVRPETKFGDTALAVNPKDKRYQKYIGKEIEAKGILGPLKFKVIADDAVDPKFGTGVVKITPAHDQADFEVWQRHKNEIEGPFGSVQGKPKIVIDENGRLTGIAGPFAGLKVAEAREKVAEEMQKIGILEKIEPDYVHQIATCYKCGTTLEPIPKPQWFVRMTAKPAAGCQLPADKTKSLRDLGIWAVKSGKIKFIPKRIEKVYSHWLKNIRDWNISRQIVWGIRIPAWYCFGCREIKTNLKTKSGWFLIRHGETNFNAESRTQGHLESRLTEKGKNQIKSIAAVLKNKKIDLIISSDLVRCRETAEIIAGETGAELIFDKNLKERKLGVLEGVLRTEMQDVRQEVNSSWQSRPTGGESWEEVANRVWKSFSAHHKKHSHKNVVVVTHGGPIRTILARIKGWNFEQMIQFRPENASMLELDIAEPCKKCGSHFYEQDPDVFDTWFSSGQWPFATLMTSNKRHETRGRKSDFETFYPTDVMETAYDILFFWVARMVMLGLYRTGKIPFKTVYIHGLVRDKDRQKMSKSKGNVIDPLGVAEIYGTDAVRMALVIGNTAGNDIVISEDKIRGYRNFATKIWNVARFVLMHKPAQLLHSKTLAGRPVLTKQDRKNLDELKKNKAHITKHIEKFEFHLAAEKLYHYFWHTFADKIIEEYKPRLRGAPSAGAPADQAAAYYILETIFLECLKMLHPFMPFISEEIYQKFYPDKLLMTEKW
jgi:valyl-tRNA synthetase